MSILVSTHVMEKEAVFRDLPNWLEEGVGVEIFPQWKREGFEEELQSLVPWLRERPIQFHSPYYGIEPSLQEDDEGFEEMMWEQKKTLAWAVRLRAKGIVFHHNNGKIQDKKSTMERVHRGYQRLRVLSDRVGVMQIVENAGVQSLGNALFNEEEFIAYCQLHEVPCLIDIGHVHCNGWDLERVMHDLQSRIRGYHLHNNDGRSDSHRRIGDGTLDMHRFASLFRKYTPEADVVLEYSAHGGITAEQVREDTKWVRENLYDLPHNV